MSFTSESVRVRTLDGLHLAATLVTPDRSVVRLGGSLVMVHGGGVTRDEGGFFTRLAAGVAQAGIASLRFDLRGHGESEGRQEDLTLAAILNDIRVALADMRERTGEVQAGLLGTSFAGGICGYYAAERPEELHRLVLLNPQFDYKRRTIDSRDYWTDDYLDESVAARLADTGYIDFKPGLRHGRAILNEVFWLRPHEAVGRVQTPTLLVHGTEDTLVDIATTRAAAARLQVAHRLVEIEGAQHGFAVHDDPEYRDPRSQAWQASVIATVSQWLTE
ncbi:alpha/beta hydrolase [Actinokineospora enzanensis]|uniref:alpha/beta hydrolase n=1 Tax=Actinokineospora enzanensis TaxID=155975 RepID=UPI000475AFBA|nr:alpha/beta fold hydrolase [Actinokineospora enzanensis]